MAFIAACSPTYTNTADDTADGYEDRGPSVVDVAVACNPDASVTDWLIQIAAVTDGPADDVLCTFTQRGDDFGPYYLNDKGDNNWYGEMWEDDLGVDCDVSTPGATCEALEY